MNGPAVVDVVAHTLVEEHLAGLRGYNPMAAAVDLLMRAVQSSCVSVSHAKAVLSSFDDQCPTPREIKEVAQNSRERFLPRKPPPEEEWKKQYGPPDPEWSGRLLGAAIGKDNLSAKEKFHAMALQSWKDALYYASPAGQAELNRIVGSEERAAAKRFWADALIHNERDHPEEMAALRAGREPEPPPDKRLRKAAPINSEGFDGPILKPVTAESFQGVEPVSLRRCPTCGGSGRLAGDDYCNDCEIGRDLRRQEARYKGDA